jgi:hypothetical protein
VIFITSVRRLHRRKCRRSTAKTKSRPKWTWSPCTKRVVIDNGKPSYRARPSCTTSITRKVTRTTTGCYKRIFWRRMRYRRDHRKLVQDLVLQPSAIEAAVAAAVQQSQAAMATALFGRRSSRPLLRRGRRSRQRPPTTTVMRRRRRLTSCVFRCHNCSGCGSRRAIGL